MRVRVIDPKQFEFAVFGGWCFLKNFPEITKGGVEVQRHTNGNYYIMGENGRPADGVGFGASTCFFSPEEMKYLEVVKQPALTR